MPSSASYTFDEPTVQPFVKIALVRTSRWSPTAHVTLHYSSVESTVDHKSRGHHLEQRHSLQKWNKYKFFSKSLRMVSNWTMSSFIGAILSFISDFISHSPGITNNILLIQHNYTTNLEIGVCALFALTESIDLCWQRQTTLLHHWVQLLWLLSPWWATPDPTSQWYSSATSLPVLDVTVEWTTKSAFKLIVAVTTSGSDACYEFIEQSCFRKTRG